MTDLDRYLTEVMSGGMIFKASVQVAMHQHRDLHATLAQIKIIPPRRSSRWYSVADHFLRSRGAAEGIVVVVRPTGRQVEREAASTTLLIQDRIRLCLCGWGRLVSARRRFAGRG